MLHTGAGIRRAQFAADGLRNVDAVKVEVQTKLPVCLLPRDELDIVHNGRVGSVRVGKWCVAPEEARVSSQAARGRRDGRDWWADTSNRSLVFSIISQSENVSTEAPRVVNCWEN